MTPHPIASPDVLILCGGEGTRLRSVVSDRPKALAEINGKPFLDMLIDNLHHKGFERIILCTGYQREQLKARYASQNILFSEEESPLGTGGAIKKAEPLVVGENFLVMNGDSAVLGDVDFESIRKFHLEKHALVTMVLAHPRQEKDYGTVRLASDTSITHFGEKENDPENHFMSAGIYMMSKKVFNAMPQGTFSLENDFFPTLAGAGLHGYPVSGKVIDIGTPERYAKAKEFFS